MITKTYALANRSKADCENLGTSAPITHIQVGDIVASGFGTLTWHYAEVVAVTHVPQYAAFRVTYADGKSTTDTVDGFWYNVIKGDPAQAEAAAKFATAYAKAWDRQSRKETSRV